METFFFLCKDKQEIRTTGTRAMAHMTDDLFFSILRTSFGDPVNSAQHPPRVKLLLASSSKKNIIKMLLKGAKYAQKIMGYLYSYPSCDPTSVVPLTHIPPQFYPSVVPSLLVCTQTDRIPTLVTSGSESDQVL